jgi:peptide/nickel transport system permease protein
MTTNTGTAPAAKRVEKKRHGVIYDVLSRMIREKPLATFGLAVIVVLLIIGIFASFLAPYGMNEIHLLDRLQAPSSHYLLGTDELGRDILSRLIYGARISMIIGLSATALSTVLSVFIGGISAYIGGRLDLIVQRFIDVWMAIPSFLILMTIMSMVNNKSGSVWPIIVVLGVTTGIGGSRFMRSAVISIKSNMYVSATEAIGCGPVRTMLRHIVPNIMAPIIVSFTIGVGGAIMAEASLSYLGLGVPPNVPSWGSMISLEGQKYFQQTPQLALWPGFALSIVVFGINMFGDGLRDLLDPRLRGGVGRYSMKGSTLEKLKARVDKYDRDH